MKSCGTETCLLSLFVNCAVYAAASSSQSESMMSSLTTLLEIYFVCPMLHAPLLSFHSIRSTWPSRNFLVLGCSSPSVVAASSAT